MQKVLSQHVVIAVPLLEYVHGILTRSNIHRDWSAHDPLTAIELTTCFSSGHLNRTHFNAIAEYRAVL
jgi:hypothetical protein